MGLFLKSFVWCRVYGEKVRATLKTVERNLNTSSPDHWSAHTFLYTGLKACGICENIA